MAQQIADSVADSVAHEVHLMRWLHKSLASLHRTLGANTAGVVTKCLCQINRTKLWRTSRRNFGKVLHLSGL
jgi:hypothetical protein